MGVGIRDRGRSPKLERRRRSERMRERSRKARAKSEERVERREGVFRVVGVDWLLVEEEREGQRAVIVGESLKSRFVPRTEVVNGRSQAL